jgi:hypothetical protein
MQTNSFASSIKDSILGRFQGWCFIPTRNVELSSYDEGKFLDFSFMQTNSFASSIKDSILGRFQGWHFIPTRNLELSSYDEGKFLDFCVKVGWNKKVNYFPFVFCFLFCFCFQWFITCVHFYSFYNFVAAFSYDLQKFQKCWYRIFCSIYILYWFWCSESMWRWKGWCIFWAFMV